MDPADILSEGRKADVAVMGGILILLVSGGLILGSGGADKTAEKPEVTEGPIHWHAGLGIQIHDQRLLIPAGIGITKGNNIDNDISGLNASPIHTHDRSGRLHIEHRVPKKEAMTLGYFINDVWGRRFSSRCILRWCNDGENRVQTFVRHEGGRWQRIHEMEDYVIRDGDQIRIFYGEVLGREASRPRQLF